MQLTRVSGSGREGRITKQDILAYVESRKSGQQPVIATPVAQPATPPKTAPVVHAGDRTEVVKMDRMR